MEISSSSVTFPGNCDGGTTNTFNTLTENQRPGLALINGVVYVGWASHGDQGGYHGWLVGYNTADLSISNIFNATPNTAESLSYCRGGIWMSGGAPAADASNNLYLITGNGVFDGVTDYSDSYLKMSTPGLGVTDFFTPNNQSNLDANDQDVGASGTALLIDQTSGPVTHLLVGGSKASVIFLINRDNFGKFNASTDAVVQEFTVSGHSFSTPAFWNNNLYYFGAQYTTRRWARVSRSIPRRGCSQRRRLLRRPRASDFPERHRRFPRRQPRRTASCGRLMREATERVTMAARRPDQRFFTLTAPAAWPRSCGIARRLGRTGYGGERGEVYRADRGEWQGVHRNAGKRQHPGRGDDVWGDRCLRIASKLKTDPTIKRVQSGRRLTRRPDFLLGLQRTAKNGGATAVFPQPVSSPCPFVTLGRSALPITCLRSWGRHRLRGLPSR